MIKPIESVRQGDEFWSDGVFQWRALQDALVAQDEVRIEVQYRDGGRGLRTWDRGITLLVQS